jgi:hypothetical protein
MKYARLKPNDPRIRAGVHGHVADTTQARWLRTQFDQKCMRCYSDVKKGQEVILLPRERSVLCQACGTELEEPLIPEGFDAICGGCHDPYTFANARAMKTETWERFCCSTCESAVAEGTFLKLRGIGMATIWKMKAMQEAGGIAPSEWPSKGNRMPLLISLGLAHHTRDGGRWKWKLTEAGERYLALALIEFYKQQGVQPK